MVNVKGVAIATDGEMKRMAVTYDIIDDSGVITTSNAKINRVVTDEDTLAAITTVETYAKSIIEE